MGGNRMEWDGMNRQNGTEQNRTEWDGEHKNITML